MPESITPLLADRLDISEDRAEVLLNDMLQELRNRTRTEGVQLSELGTFREENGTLTFVPSSSLRRRVNRQFEGLSTEDLSAPSEKESPPSLRASSPEEEPEEHSSDEASPESVGNEEAEDIPTITLTEEAEESPSPPDETESTPTDTPSPKPEDDSEAEEPSPAETEFPATVLSIVGSIALVLLLAGGGWFLFTQTSLFSSGSGGPRSGTAETEASPAPSSTKTKPTDTVPAERPTNNQSPDRPAGAKPGNQKAAASSAAQGPWTLVVASRTSQAAAEQTANRYEGAFAAVQVVPGTVDGHTWYRVTLGRYASKADARRALQAHASELPTDAWIHRLQ
ncbi:MAG: SPOR domain-containing protein [Salinibacter sp.]